MIATVFGTTGELIKLAPLLVRLGADGRPPLVLTTGQQATQIPAMLDDFGLPQPHVWLGRGNDGADLQTLGDLPGWATTVARRFSRLSPRLRRLLHGGVTEPIFVVHGDTMTTVLGALMGRALGVPVAHIEGGLRSGDWRNPFPEELNRRAATRLARVHFAPGPWAAANLLEAHAPGTTVDTGFNTIRDAMTLVPADAAVHLDLPDEPFGIVSLHRQELLGRPKALRDILEELERASERQPLLFIDHPITAAAVRSAGLDGVFGPRFRRVPRQRYFGFIALLKSSTFLVTDSGGSQEECAALGHPCLVHRAATERLDGLGGPVRLSGMDPAVVRAFLADPQAHAHPPAEPAVSPTEHIVAYLRRAGHLAPG